MIETFTEETFLGHLNTRFQVFGEAADPLDVELVKVTSLSSPGQVQFSIQFQGPGHQLLPQRIYTLEHEILGKFDLFLVPVGRNDSGFEYEAVFNRVAE
jgi:hypothetical protein